MPADYGQMLRNLGYGAIHRPAQLVQWLAAKLDTPTLEPLLAPIRTAAADIDQEAAEQLQPYVPSPPALQWGPPPSTPPVRSTIPAIGQVTGCLGYDPEIAPLGQLAPWQKKYPTLTFQLQWHWHGWWGCWSVWRTH